MRKFVIGNGMVGSVLMRRGYSGLDCDVTNEPAVKECLRIADPDIVIYAAGFTNIDDCENDPHRAIAVNAGGVSNILNHYRGPFIYISSDHIFNGQHFFGEGYAEFHNPRPVNIYGRSKQAGEIMTGSSRLGKVVRTSKLFNQAYLEKSIESLPKEVTNVMKRSFLHVEHFCDGLEYFVEHFHDMPGVLNISGSQIISHYRLLTAYLRFLGMDENLVTPINKKQAGYTPRPIQTGLSMYKAVRLGLPVYSYLDGFEL